MSIRVSIIEDDAALRTAIRERIAGDRRFDIVSDYASAEAAIKQLPQDRPDVVLSDINLPGMSGIDCVRKLKPQMPETQFLMLTVYEDSERIFQALTAGATGYLVKRASRSELLDAIIKVHRGESPMSSGIARKIVASFQRTEPAETDKLLGSMDNASRHTTGSVGEVRIHNAALSPAEFSRARIAMTDQWVRQPTQNLDATVAGSVIGNPVTQWTDQSGNANHASAATGSVSYPSTNHFPTGPAGLEFGPAAESLQLLGAANTAGLLDFNGAASTHTGFSILMSVRVDQLNPSGEPNDLIGVTSNTATGGFGLRLNSVGRIVTYMGGSVIPRPESDREVAAGNAVIIALNYDAATGVLTIWDSLNETEVTATIPKGNFAGTNLPLKLGSLDSSIRYLIGFVGEVKFFAENLTASDFAAQRDAMTLKWVGVSPLMPAMPVKPVFTVAQLLNWNPATDADAPFNVATVPLQSRINVPAGLKANPNSRIGQGGVQALDTYAGDRPQGGSGSVYTFTYWQYLEESVYWGGISSINIVPPTGEMIDNAHRNGVPILGTVFFPPLVYGGNYSWVQTFLTKVGNTYPTADKLIEMAEYYGFDGWFINQETEIPAPVPRHSPLIPTRSGRASRRRPRISAAPPPPGSRWRKSSPMVRTTSPRWESTSRSNMPPRSPIRICSGPEPAATHAIPRRRWAPAHGKASPTTSRSARPSTHCHLPRTSPSAGVATSITTASS